MRNIVMCIERVVRFFAGIMVLASLLLAHFVSPWFYAVTIFVGLNLAQSGLTNWCLLVNILRRFGLRDCVSPRIAA